MAALQKILEGKPFEYEVKQHFITVRKVKPASPVPKVRRNRSPGNKSRQATASRGSIPTSVPASREPTLPSTANRITADKQRTGNARRTENPSQPTLSGNRGRAADPTGIRNDRLRSSAMVNFRSENAGQRDRKSTRLNSSHGSESRMPSSA